jgi:acyl carrier protein
MAKPIKRKNKTKSVKNKGNLIPRIQRIIADQLKKKPNQITLTSELQADLQGDSLDALEIIFKLEEEFKIKIDEQDARKMVTVQDIVNDVTKRVKR